MFDKQKEAYTKISRLKVGALFMKMGTGKTKVALDLARNNNINQLIYVAPFSSLGDIKKEFEKWEYRGDYTLIGYETIQASDRKFLEVLNSIKQNSMIIADESIFIKNEETKRFQRLCAMRKKCEYALILNGTPLTKDEWDIYNQMEFLSPLILKMSRNEFLNTFFKKITYKKSGKKEQSFYKFSEVNAEHLKNLIAPYIFKCDLDFNKKITTSFQVVTPSPESLDAYQARKAQLLRTLENSDFHNGEAIRTALLNLNYIASCDKNKAAKVIEYSQNKKVIIYCNFIKEVEYLSSKMKCHVITGNIKNRGSIRESFSHGSIPLIMTYGVGSYSLNMQYCNEIVFSSINFDYGEIEQAKYRIQRGDQTDDIKYTSILSDFQIVQLIQENLKRKSTLDGLIKIKMEEGFKEWEKCI